MSFKARTWLAAFFILTTSTAWAADSDALKLDVHQKQLSNGLTVLVVERPVPVVALAMSVAVGNMDSPKGMTGLPHMLEHMMFKGSQTVGTKSYEKEKPILAKMDVVEAQINAENAKPSPSKERLDALDAEVKKLQDEHRNIVVKDELDALYSRHGGRSLNAWTSQDLTTYTVLLPANQMPVYAALEEDRLSHPVFREFYSERDVVMQERRQGESQPSEALWEALGSAAYRVHPYHNPVIGWMGEIRKLLRPDIEAFYKKAYRPDRAVLAVVGGVKAGEVFSLLERTVGQVPNPSEAPLEGKYPAEPPQDKERRVEITFPADPMADLGWHQPGFPDKDAVALSVLSNILTGGNSSRLTKKLVLDDKVAVGIGGGDSGLGGRAPGLFVLQYVPAPGKSLETVLKAVDREIAQVRKEGVTEEELARSRRTVEASFLWAKDSPEGMAGQLAVMQAVYGDWKVLEQYFNAINLVDSEAVRTAARRYLVDSNRTVAFLKKGEAGKEVKQ